MSSDQVRDRYAAAARRAGDGSLDGRLATGEPADAPAGDRFGAGGYQVSDIAGAPDGAVAASLGCGNPLTVADLRAGDTVLDLGSGGGLDALVSARRVGPAGRVIGLDMTEEMLALARRHAADAGVSNVEFRRGRIEEIPLEDASVDVVISNCVIALSEDKARVFAEIARVLVPGGRVGISDVLADADLSDAERAARADKVECLAGALTEAAYRTLLQAAGLVAVEVQRTYEAGDKLFAATVRAVRPLHGPDDGNR